MSVGSGAKFFILNTVIVVLLQNPWGGMTGGKNKELRGVGLGQKGRDKSPWSKEFSRSIIGTLDVLVYMSTCGE